MNRLLICIILLSFGNTASAEALYRWIEPDGSITFSPTKPPAGVKFKTVEASAGAGQISDQITKPSILATSEHGAETALPPVNDTKILTRPAPAVATRQGLNYAPETSSRSITKAELNTAPTEPKNAVANRNTAASSNKRRQCQDLSKRVVSLERRLRSPLAPEDMDNTVIAMVRYQRSYDQHCIE